MKGQERKARTRGAAGAAKPNATRDSKPKRGSREAAPVARKTRTVASKKAAGPNKEEARRVAAKTNMSRRAQKVAGPSIVKEPSVQTISTVPSVERVKAEARVLSEAGAGWVEPESRYALPDSYGKDRVVAMSRDPYWVFVYWEVTEATISRALQGLGRARLDARRVLRVYTRDGEGKDRILFDISLTPEARNWYVNVGGPGRTYRIDVGLLTAGGKFVCLASSNIVTTPRDRMSDVLDEKWMSLASEYEEMYALSGGLSRGVSSPELHERLARELEVRLASPLFSPGMREAPGGKEEVKPFWFTLDTDLVVYGATVPGSGLKVDGEKWQLREDGTFSFRCHLPDGSKEIDVAAHSPDGTGKEQVKLKVNRIARQTKG